MGRTRQTLVAVAFTLVSCSSQILPAATPTTQAVTLRVYATTSALPLLNDLTTAYTRLNPTISFETASGNYQAMLDRLMRGEAPYFFTNHLPPEADDALWAAPVGQDGIAVIVHPSNPVRGLTTTQVRDIYQGWISRWDAVGGQPREIVVLSREDGAGARAEFESLVMGDRRTSLSARIAPSSEAMVLSAARDPNAIGYVSVSYLDSRVRSLAIDGVLPTLDAVYAHQYPLRALLYIVGLREPDGTERPDADYRAFIGWTQSREGQSVVARRYAPLLRP